MRAKVFEKRKLVESGLQEIPSKQVRPLLSIYFFMRYEPVPGPSIEKIWTGYQY